METTNWLRKAPTMTRSQVSTDVESGSSPPPDDALLTRIVGALPRSEVARRTASLTASSLVASASIAIARPPVATISSTVSAAPAGFRSTTATDAPLPASRSDVARPMPDPPPVTNATRFPNASLISYLLPYWGPDLRRGLADGRSGTVFRRVTEVTVPDPEVTPAVVNRSPVIPGGGEVGSPGRSWFGVSFFARRDAGCHSRLPSMPEASPMNPP